MTVETRGIKELIRQYYDAEGTERDDAIQAIIELVNIERLSHQKANRYRRTGNRAIMDEDEHFGTAQLALIDELEKHRIDYSLSDKEIINYLSIAVRNAFKTLRCRNFNPKRHDTSMVYLAGLREDRQPAHPNPSGLTFSERVQEHVDAIRARVTSAGKLTPAKAAALDELLQEVLDGGRDGKPTLTGAEKMRRVRVMQTIRELCPDIADELDDSNSRAR